MKNCLLEKTIGLLQGANKELIIEKSSLFNKNTNFCKIRICLFLLDALLREHTFPSWFLWLFLLQQLTELTNQKSDENCIVRNQIINKSEVQKCCFSLTFSYKMNTILRFVSKNIIFVVLSLILLYGLDVLSNLIPDKG